MGRTATLLLRCDGGGDCLGSASLVARKGGGRAAKLKGKHSGAGRARIVLGTASFSIPAGASEAIQVRLSTAARALVRSAGKRGLTVVASGADVKTAALLLRQAKPRAARRSATHG